MASRVDASTTPGGVYHFFQDGAAVSFVATAEGRENQHEKVQTPTQTAHEPSFSDKEARESVQISTHVDAPAVDRVFTYDSHFGPDKPFTIHLKSGESLLLPLDPIRDLLYPSTGALSQSPAAAAAAVSRFALGLELSNCRGKFQSFILLKNKRMKPFSTASYQCMTITNANEEQQQNVNLCPQYDPSYPATMRLNPFEIDGFILRADIGEPVESIALLRSTKSSGGFEKAFLVDTDAGDDLTPTPFNVSFSYRETTLAFASPSIWEHPAEPSNLSKAPVCEACEYFLYAERLEPDATVSNQDALPYCIQRRSSVQYQVPTKSLTNALLGNSTDKHAKLDDLFADQFKSSGEYRFVLVASLPSSANHRHPAMLAYAPQQLSVTAHFFIAFVVVGLVALAAIFAVQYHPHLRFSRGKSKTKASALDAEDEAEFMRLLADSTAASIGTMNSLEEGLLPSEELREYDDDDAVGDISGRNSLLVAIKRTKEQQQPQLDGYHEIS
ncbi:hypothetical protein FI667_g6142, partial [Globisporangium splendens]